MKEIKVGPVPGYEDMQFLEKKKPEPKRLKWHTSYGSIFVYDDQGNSCTIQRGDADHIYIADMYTDGEQLDIAECDYDFFNHILCPFTYEDLKDFLNNYRDYVGSIY
jgi:hypothetical protein